jgi:WD40 repeat protein
VYYVAFSPTNSQHLISISGGVIHQWDINGHQIEPTYQGSHAAFSLDGTHLALCEGNVTTVQNCNSGAIVAKFPTDKNPSCCCFSPNGRLVAVAAGATAYVWDITGSDPHLIETFTGHTDDITSLTFSSSSSSLISASHDKSAKFWQIGTPSTDLVAGDPNSTPPILASVESISLQAECGIAISSDLDGVVRIWDISTGLCKGSLQTPAKGKTLRDAQMVDDRLIVVWREGGKIHSWDTEKGELLQAVEIPQDGPRDLRISGDGSKVFLLAGRFIRGWSLLTGEAVGEVELEDESYLDLCRVGGSRICLHFPNLLALGWDFVASGPSPVSLPNTPLERPCLGFTGGASWWYKGPSLIQDTVTGKEIFHFSGRYAKPCEVQWDGQYLVAGYESGDVLILDFVQMLPQ